MERELFPISYKWEMNAMCNDVNIGMGWFSKRQRLILA